MRYYEMTFIIHPNVPDEELSVITDKVIAVVNRNQGEVITLDNWGKRRCAHKIKKCVKGHYFLLCFAADPGALLELNRTLRYDEKVLRYQTVAVEKQAVEALMKQKGSQSQAAGGEPSAETE